jgi:hypothetical protein
MSVIDRFTRDAASKYLWAVMTLVAIGGLAFGITSGSDALDDERATSQTRAVRYVERLEPRLEGGDVAGPLSGQRAASLEAAVERSILADERVSRVRIWSTDGTLLFSTDPADTPGSDAGLNDDVLGQASREGALTRSNTSDTGGQDDPERSLLRTYAPIGTSIVAEIDQTDEGTLAPVRTEWLSYQVLAGVMVLVFLVLTGLSLREPFERINVGVPFATSSIPKGFSLIDDERLHAVHEVYRLASERVARLEEKLEESEEARRGLEGDIQRALSKATSSSPRVDVPAAASPPAPVVPEPAIVQVPESEVVAGNAPRSDAWAAAPAGPLARASRDQKPPPSSSRKPNAPAAKPKRTKRQKAKPETPPAAAREVSAPPPAPAASPAPERRVAAMATVPTTTSRSIAQPEVDDARAHEAALETFIRLTESDRQPHDTTAEVDQGAVRAALARTAARKKPGGERLQRPEVPPEESAGGQPPSD